MYLLHIGISLASLLSRVVRDLRVVAGFVVLIASATAQADYLAFDDSSTSGITVAANGFLASPLTLNGDIVVTNGTFNSQSVVVSKGSRITFTGVDGYPGYFYQPYNFTKIYAILNNPTDLAPAALIYLQGTAIGSDQEQISGYFIGQSNAALPKRIPSGANILVGSGAFVIGSTDASITIAYAPQNAQQPGLFFQGNDIANTSAPPPVVVGQQIALDAVLPSSFGAVASQKWLVAGKPIGGYTPTSVSFQAGGVRSWPSNQPSATFYWTIPTDPGEVYVVEYDYTLLSGQTGSLTTSFKVAGAPTPHVGFHVKQKGVPCVIDRMYCDIFIDSFATNPGAPTFVAMGFGSPFVGTDNYGMAIGTDTDPGSGTYLWTQLILRDNISWNNADGTDDQCVVLPGLDRRYPILNDPGVKPSILGLATIASAFQDEPSDDVDYYHPNAAKITRSFVAEVFLLWQASGVISIPVPLGSVKWSFYEVSFKNDKAINGWTTPFIASTQGQFSTNLPKYPTWRSLATKAYTGAGC